ncbi:helix-turn-helix domain-containing protein [Dietzia cinnamea]|uniref:helix-turn-helix domain-containing protein n=1 Tax=Dietzia cinnamea TaxID=321318 RepID=UPI002E2F223E|nr:helix-turn-helix domain-containing protein [Dietzia cinnamea]
MSNHPDILDGERQTRRPRSTLHLPSAFCLRIRNLRQVPVSPVQEALRSIFTQRSADPRELPGLDSLVVTYCGAVLLRLLNILVGDAPDITLSLGWPAPEGLPVDQDRLAGRLVFDASLSILHFPVDAVNHVCRFSDPVAYRLAISDLQRRLDERSKIASYSDKVRRLIEKRPADCGSQWIADELSISTSTLKRRLSEEGMTYRGLRQSVIREYAILRLLDGSVSASEIATDLGYSDLASFSHAFKHWTGHPPTGFRRR